MSNNSLYSKWNVIGCMSMIVISILCCLLFLTPADAFSKMGYLRKCLLHHDGFESRRSPQYHDVKQLLFDRVKGGSCTYNHQLGHDFDMDDGKIKHDKSMKRRTFLQTIPVSSLVFTPAYRSNAYTADTDPLRESLYFISRVQEATVQQERFVRKASNQQDLKQKMKLTLRLIEKNYRLVDQITYCSTFISSDDLVEATNAGNEAAGELQSAIDFVNNELKSGSMSSEQKEYLISALQNAREELFVFLNYVPKDKLEEARLRIERENVDNREEYDGDGTEGVYNPVVLPWKNR